MAMTNAIMRSLDVSARLASERIALRGRLRIVPMP